MRISVAGLDYAELVIVACFDQNGHSITCVDIDENKIAMLNSGKNPIFEDGIEELIKKTKTINSMIEEVI